MSYNLIVHLGKTDPTIQVFPTVYLNLGHNQITNMRKGDLERFGHLEWLDLSHNFIGILRDGSFRGLWNLRELHLGHNHISTIRRSEKVFPQSIQRLWMENNKLTQLPAALKVIQSLQILSLSNNLLTSLGPRSFLRCASLEQLHLDHNRLSHISSHDFEGLHKLRVLDLRSNPLYTSQAVFQNVLQWGTEILLTDTPIAHKAESLTDLNWIDLNLEGPLQGSNTTTAARRNQQADIQVAGAALVTISTGHGITLHCRTLNRTGHLVYWQTPLGRLDTTSHMSSNKATIMSEQDKSLRIKASSAHHQGLYYCFFSHSEGLFVTYYIVKVKEGKLRIRRAQLEEVSAGITDARFVAAIAASVVVTFLVAFILGAFARPAFAKVWLHVNNWRNAEVAEQRMELESELQLHKTHFKFDTSTELINSECQDGSAQTISKATTHTVPVKEQESPVELPRVPPQPAPRFRPRHEMTESNFDKKEQPKDETEEEDQTKQQPPGPRESNDDGEQKAPMIIPTQYEDVIIEKSPAGERLLIITNEEDQSVKVYTADLMRRCISGPHTAVGVDKEVNNSFPDTSLNQPQSHPIEVTPEREIKAMFHNSTPTMATKVDTNAPYHADFHDIKTTKEPSDSEYLPAQGDVYPDRKKELPNLLCGSGHASLPQCLDNKCSITSAMQKSKETMTNEKPTEIGSQTAAQSQKKEEPGMQRDLMDYTDEEAHMSFSRESPVDLLPPKSRKRRTIKLYNYDEEGKPYSHVKNLQECESQPATRLRPVSMNRLSGIMSSAFLENSLFQTDGSQNQPAISTEDVLHVSI
ncbi:ELFN1 protein, partial [Polypterus senegalus]